MRSLRGILLPILVTAALPGTAWGSSLYVVNNGPGNVGQYDIAADGRLSSKSPTAVTAGNDPQDIALSPDGKSAYVDQFDAPGSVFQYSIDSGGLLSAKTPPTIGAGADGTESPAVSPDGKSVYVTNYANPGSVSQYDVGTGGLLSPKSPVTVFAGDFPIGLAVSPDGKSLYVADSETTVDQYDVGADGRLSPKSPAFVASGMGSIGMAISPDGRNVYVANYSSNNVSQYDVGAGGTLSPKITPFVSTPGGPEDVAVSPDGASVYVITDTAAKVLEYDVGAGGLLTPKLSPSIGTGLRPGGIAISPDGRSVYVNNYDSASVSQYDVGVGGVLSSKSPPTVPAGTHPYYGIVVTPDQGPVAAFSTSPSSPEPDQPVGFDGSASSDPDGNVARFDWDFGDGTTLANGGATPSHTYAQSGDYAVTLTVTDDVGCSTAQVFTGQTAYCNGSVAAATHQSVAVAAVVPVVPVQASQLRIVPHSFEAAPRGPSAVTRSLRAQPKVGARVSYVLNQAATVGFKVLRSVRGGKRRLVPVRGSFKLTGNAGANSFRFSGRLRHRKLKAGKYVLVATPIVAGTKGEATRRGFRIVKGT